MKHTFFISTMTIALILGTNKLSAQEIGLGLYVVGGYNQHQWNPQPFNDFATSYNAYMAQYLESPFGKFSSTLVGFQRGFGGYYWSDHFQMGIEFFKSEFKNTRTSQFYNGRGNEIEINFVDWQFSMDMGYRFGNRFTLSGIVGTGLRSGVVDVRIPHFDGSFSIGNEFYFDGIYRSGLQSDGLFGIQARLHVLPFLDLQGRIYKTFRLFDTEEGERLGAFEDSAPGQLITASYFPIDYAQYEANAQAGIYDYENNVIPMNFRGLYIQAGVAVVLRTRSDE